MFRRWLKGRRTANLADAFEKDGFEIEKTVTWSGRKGVAAVHKTAVNYDTGKKKRVYYLEGTGYEAGYLMGMLAEPDVEAMAVDFADKIVFAFIGSRLLEKIKLLQEALIFIIYEHVKGMVPDLPQEIRDEIQGLYEGCKAANPHTRVTPERLIALNMGMDALCAMVYTGDFLAKKVPGLRPQDLRAPIFCNAFSVFGKNAGGGHYFGRDFMFPSADVFQNTAAMVIYNPAGTRDKKAYPFVSVTAPGMVGCISAMNSRGVGIGVDMAPAANCNPGRIGTNSLLLNRMCAQFADSAYEAVELMADTVRGVSWNYIIADGQNDRACVVEAGASYEFPAFEKYIPGDLASLLPDLDFLRSRSSAEYRNGLMVRWDDFEYPSDYLDFNLKLWKRYNKKLYPSAFGKDGYINRSFREDNCPSTHYFAPQREDSANLVLVTNHFIIPEMRLFGMHSWTSRIVGDKADDIQWRYDELNHRIQRVIQEKGTIDFETARQLIDFLAPYGEHPEYYAHNPRSRDGKEIRIEGCTSVFDLKNRVVESHYGYYCDPWIRITLPNYIN